VLVWAHSGHNLSYPDSQPYLRFDSGCWKWQRSVIPSIRGMGHVLGGIAIVQLRLGESVSGLQYSYSVANVIADYNLIPVNDTWHPKIPNVVYFGMDWDCPSYNLVRLFSCAEVVAKLRRLLIDRPWQRKSSTTTVTSLRRTRSRASFPSYRLVTYTLLCMTCRIRSVFVSFRVRCANPFT
jgi:hypothetical protein